MGKAKMVLRVAALASATAMVLAACGGGSDGGDDGRRRRQQRQQGKPVTGGTLTMLSLNQEFTDLDPQRAYTGEDIAFLNAYLTRSLTCYKISRDAGSRAR